jgi:hypothetical protein
MNPGIHSRTPLGRRSSPRLRERRLPARRVEGSAAGLGLAEPRASLRDRGRSESGEIEGQIPSSSGGRDAPLLHVFVAGAAEDRAPPGEGSDRRSSKRRRGDGDVSHATRVCSAALAGPNSSACPDRPRGPFDVKSFLSLPWRGRLHPAGFKARSCHARCRGPRGPGTSTHLRRPARTWMTRRRARAREAGGGPAVDRPSSGRVAAVSRAHAHLVEVLHPHVARQPIVENSRTAAVRGRERRGDDRSSSREAPSHRRGARPVERAARQPVRGAVRPHEVEPAESCEAGSPNSPSPHPIRWIQEDSAG